MCYNGLIESAQIFRLPAVASAEEGAARAMLARQAVLLNPLKSALPDCLPFYKQIAPITPLESALTGPSQLIENIATLTPAESALTDTPSVTSLDSALTKDWGYLLPTKSLFPNHPKAGHSFTPTSRTFPPVTSHR